MSTPFKRHLMIGTLPDVGKVFVTIDYTPDGNLSLSGVEGPKSDGNARGSCGQIIIGFKEYDARGYMTLDAITPAIGWTRESIHKLFDVWSTWHLNDMQAACEHQRARGETWVTHPSAICPDCHYVLGSAWLRAEVPADVVEWLRELPTDDTLPARWAA